MSKSAIVKSRGRTWFSSLTGEPITNPTASVLVKDTLLGNELVRYLSVVTNSSSRFPRARVGEIGLEEAWRLASHVRETITSDACSRKRPIIAIVDIPSQAYGLCEEALGISLALAAAVDAYVTARLAGHPVIALIVGGAFSGAFLAHGYQANCILALDAPDISIHAMGRGSAARIMRQSIPEFDKLCNTIIPMSYRILTYAQLGTLHSLIPNIQPDSPGCADIHQVKTALIRAIEDARSGPRDLSNRLQSREAQITRASSIEVCKRLTEQWLAVTK